MHAVGHAFQDGTTIDLGDWEPSAAKNLFDGATLYSIVLEVPDAELAPRAADDRVGVWAVASLATDAGGWRSINRVGLPMIHPLFTQFNEQLGDDLNAGVPSDDFDAHGAILAKEIAGVVSVRTAPQKILPPTASTWHTDSSQTYCPTPSEPRLPSGSPVGTDAR